MKKQLALTPKVDLIELTSYKYQGEQLAIFLADQTCDTAEKEVWFSSQLSTVRALLKGLEDRRSAVVKPLLEAKREADSLFSPATKPLQQCEAIIRGKLQAAATARLQAAAAARALAETASAAGDFEAVVDALASVPSEVKGAGSSAKGVWVPEVVDFAALEDRFKMVDEAALAMFAKMAGGEPPAIPGVVWRLEAKIRAK